MPDCSQCYYGRLWVCYGTGGPSRDEWRCSGSPRNDPETCTDFVPRGTPRAELPVPSWLDWQRCPACGTLRRHRSTRAYLYLECPLCGHTTRRPNGPSGNPRNHASCHARGVSPTTGRLVRF